MKFQKVGSKWIVRINKGEEILTTLKKFCSDNKIFFGTVSGIGAVNRAVIGLFETSAKEYHTTEYTGDYEVTSLLGNITTMNNEVYLHLHINLAGPDNRTIGGHLSSAFVSGTIELFIDAIEDKLEREFDETVGLNLWKL